VQKTYTTTRLKLDRLHLNDAAFIFELLNTEGWIKFIGDRNIRSIEDSEKFIEKTVKNPDIVYWVVKTIDEKYSMGIISFVKRENLEFRDIGFAFLPVFSKRGYAFEAAEIVLKDLLQDPDNKIILATMKAENIDSIKLIEKLGFRFDSEIENNKVKSLRYSIMAD
jgi:[ribosomal protein S5]-alanine N-acetyltransferase